MIGKTLVKGKGVKKCMYKIINWLPTWTVLLDIFDTLCMPYI